MKKLILMAAITLSALGTAYAEAASSDQNYTIKPNEKVLVACEASKNISISCVGESVPVTSGDCRVKGPNAGHYQLWMGQMLIADFGPTSISGSNDIELAKEEYKEATYQLQKAKETLAKLQELGVCL